MGIQSKFNQFQFNQLSWFTSGMRTAAAVATCLVIGVLSLRICYGQTAGRELVLVDSEHARAEVLGPDADGNWRFAMDGKATDVPKNNFIRWGAAPSPRSAAVFCLTDGSLIAGATGRVEINQVVIRLSDWQEISIPRNIVRAIVFQIPGGAQAWDDLISNIYKATGNNDTLLLGSGDQRSGVIQLQAGTSTLWDSAKPEDKVSMLNAGSAGKINSSDISAIIFSPDLTPVLNESKDQWQIGWADGMLLNASNLRLDSDDRLVAKLISGPELRMLDPLGDTISALRYLSHNNSRVEYLSDSQPVSYRQIPLLGQSWELGINKDLFGRNLLVDSLRYPKGLAMHSAAQAAYRVPEGASDFRASLDFIDPVALADFSQASVTAKVLVLAGGTLETVQSSGTLTPESQAWAVTVPLGDRSTPAQAIVLVIEYGDHADVADHVVWLDARFSKP